MAKKKEGPPVEAVAEPKLKPVRLDLPPDLHRMLRLVAADQGTSMASYARDLLARHLPEELKQRGMGGKG
jgi:hypothetical protein